MTTTTARQIAFTNRTASVRLIVSQKTRTQPPLTVFFLKKEHEAYYENERNLGTKFKPCSSCYYFRISLPKFTFTCTCLQIDIYSN